MPSWTPACAAGHRWPGPIRAGRTGGPHHPAPQRRPVHQLVFRRHGVAGAGRPLRLDTLPGPPATADKPRHHGPCGVAGGGPCARRHTPESGRRRLYWNRAGTSRTPRPRLRRPCISPAPASASAPRNWWTGSTLTLLDPGTGLYLRRRARQPQPRAVLGTGALHVQPGTGPGAHCWNWAARQTCTGPRS